MTSLTFCQGIHTWVGDMCWLRFQSLWTDDDDNIDYDYDDEDNNI